MLLRTVWGTWWWDCCDFLTKLGELQYCAPWWFGGSMNLGGSKLSRTILLPPAWKFPWGPKWRRPRWPPSLLGILVPFSILSKNLPKECSKDGSSKKLPIFPYVILHYPATASWQQYRQTNFPLPSFSPLCRQTRKVVRVTAPLWCPFWWICNASTKLQLVSFEASSWISQTLSWRAGIWVP